MIQVNEMDKLNVRQPAVAGLFYPVEPRALIRQITELFERAKPPKIKGEIKALIAPHAGYIYSGLTAAYSYKSLENKKYDTVVIISPSHREYFKGVSIFPGTCYKTPLGEVPIDIELSKEIIAEEKLVFLSMSGHHDEHALEVHLPFLQMTLEKFKLVPLVMGDQAPENCIRLGKALAKVLKSAAGKKKILIVASTDLSHFHPYETAKQLDQKVIDSIANFDYMQLLKDLDNQITEACGGGPTAAAMIAAKGLGADKAQILYSCNSGDVTGEKREVVGYLSAAIYKQTTNASH